jgi:hypothetical protein
MVGICNTQKDDDKCVDLSNFSRKTWWGDLSWEAWLYVVGYYEMDPRQVYVSGESIGLELLTRVPQTKGLCFMSLVFQHIFSCWVEVIVIEIIRVNDSCRVINMASCTWQAVTCNAVAWQELEEERRRKKDGVPADWFIFSGMTDHSLKVDIFGSSLFPRQEEEVKMKAYSFTCFD